MKKTPLGPGKAALDRGSTFSSPRTEIKRTKQPPKRSQPRRDWTAARAKVTDERICRAWLGDGCAGVVEAAHIIGRECDRFVALFSFEMETLDASTHPETTYSEWNVDPLRIVPLCTKHHRAYDRHDLDILPTLTTEEQVQAVADAGSIVTALQRTTGQRYAPESEALAVQPPSKDYELPESLQDRELLIALLEAAWIPWGDSRYQDNPALAEARSKLQQTLEALSR